MGLIVNSVAVSTNTLDMGHTINSEDGWLYSVAISRNRLTLSTLYISISGDAHVD